MTSQPDGSNEVAVTLTLPLSTATPLAPPLLVTWLEVTGPLVLTGTAPKSLPALPPTGWLLASVVLSGAGWLALRARYQARSSSST